MTDFPTLTVRNPDPSLDNLPIEVIMSSSLYDDDELLLLELL
eukprot:CAMPEP_0185736548 /NCGR_PEP_ID=MMETSP1171-20130828/28198_1 /TAXON_ID=374046 /ORGANISM="Helicotheca tamensis, Strain CCMP826" /LENGTH=41 /DNA_ID= /DNA_START= /DNA_END= /DNA_ORIENTATION=